MGIATGNQQEDSLWVCPPIGYLFKDLRDRKAITLYKFTQPYLCNLCTFLDYVLLQQKVYIKNVYTYTVGGNANQYSHYGEQCGDSVKNWKQNCHTTQQSNCWAYTLGKPELKETVYPNVHRSTVYNSQDMEATQMSIGRRIDKKAVVHILNRMLFSY